MALAQTFEFFAMVEAMDSSFASARPRKKWLMSPSLLDHYAAKSMEIFSWQSSIMRPESESRVNFTFRAIS